MKRIVALAVIGAGFDIATPAMAQSAPTIIVFGDDPCPPGEICVRAPESERYRIPQQIRQQQQVAPENQSWATRQESVLQEGTTGIGSCSTVGPGGGIGCSARAISRGSNEARERQSQQNSPLIP